MRYLQPGLLPPLLDFILQPAFEVPPSLLINNLCSVCQFPQFPHWILQPDILQIDQHSTSIVQVHRAVVLLAKLDAASRVPQDDVPGLKVQGIHPAYECVQI